ncbi:ankyrin repeat, PH and SEC7 domain containing protein secG-like [Watersipora subatra]|uniref:ankyrin repeat, PH and SEC7 domain containing protein secG-like n=1 Tax=Watersipora subatra TaxID=2589382 RepID=UPI00355BB408
MLGSVSLVTFSSLLNIKNSDKRTPLEEAVFRGKKESSELLKRWEKQPVVESVNYGFSVMDRGESPNIPYTVLRCRFVKGCSCGYNIRLYATSISSINTQMAEQKNSYLRGLKSMLSYMTQNNFISHLNMEGLLKSYVKERKMKMHELRAALESVQPAELLRLLITIKHDSYSAILVAAYKGHTEICRLLLSPIRRTADELLWMKENDGYTALHIAAGRGYSECVELLIDTVSDERKYKFVAEKDEYGTTAIAVAAEWGSSKCIESLLYIFSSLQRDSLLNIQDNYLNTPLHCAAYNGQTTALKVMLGSVSLVTVASLLNIKNKYKRTPLEEAEFMGNKDSSELLKRWKKQPVVEALNDAKQQIKTLQKKTEQQAGALDDARQRITTLQLESDQKLSALQREGEQKVSALQRESDQKVSALQRHTQQQAEALVEARQQVTTLQEDSERMLLLVQEEARQQRAELSATQRRLEQFAAYLQAQGDTNLTDNQCHHPNS